MPEETIDFNKKYILAVIVFAAVLLFTKPFVRGWKKASVQCAEKGCSLEAKGYDIETCYDKDDQPVYAVYYECPQGHTFIAEFERSFTEEIYS